MSAIVDAETMAALKVLRGDNKPSIDQEFSSGLAQSIVDAVTASTEASTKQSADLVSAVQEQTAVLQKLTELLQTKQKTTVMVVNAKDGATSTSSVASTAALTEADMSAITEDPSVAAAIAAAPTLEEVAEEPTVQKSGWGFVESKEAAERRKRVVLTSGSYRILKRGEEAPANAFEPVSAKEVSKNGDSLFGKISGSDLEGDSFGATWSSMKSPVNQYGKLDPPRWSASAKKPVRDLLPKLAIDGETLLKFNSGIYYLTLQYSNPGNNPAFEAAVVIGEIAFDNSGTIMAPGAKIPKLLKGIKQTEERVPPPIPKWYSGKASEAWKDGDMLRFKIDTNTNTITYTVAEAGSKKAKAGFKFEGILNFTNLPTYKKGISSFVYCGGKGKLAKSVGKLTIVDPEAPPAPAGSISSIEEVPTEEEPAAAEEKEEAPAEGSQDLVAETDAPVEE